MRVPSAWPSAYEFACHSKACAPPPTGRGGSKPGGGLRSAVKDYMDEVDADHELAFRRYMAKKAVMKPRRVV